MDLSGPMQAVSFGGSLYFMLLVDEFSRWVFFLHQKSEAFTNITKWLALVKNESRQTLKTLCANKDGEFTSNAMVDFCS